MEAKHLARKMPFDERSPCRFNLGSHHDIPLPVSSSRPLRCVAWSPGHGAGRCTCGGCILGWDRDTPGTQCRMGGGRSSQPAICSQ